MKKILISFIACIMMILSGCAAYVDTSPYPPAVIYYDPWPWPYYGLHYYGHPGPFYHHGPFHGGHR